VSDEALCEGVFGGLWSVSDEEVLLKVCGLAGRLTRLLLGERPWGQLKFVDQGHKTHTFNRSPSPSMQRMRAQGLRLVLLLRDRSRRDRSRRDCDAL
jgi:hypothetical protein